MKLASKKVVLLGLLVVLLLAGSAYFVRGADLQGRLKGVLSPLSPMSLKPDLLIEEIYLDDDVLTVVAANDSRVKVNSSTAGHTYIYIDGTLEWTYSWTTLSDKNFLKANKSSSLTPQSLEIGHTVEACVDANNVVSESNETNNCLEVWIDEAVTRGAFVQELMSAVSGAEYTGECAGGVFPDVDEDDEYCAAIEAAYDAGFISGFADGTFDPDNYLTRAEGVKVIVLAFLGVDAVDSSYDAGFSDVEPTAWYAEYVNTAHLYGIAQGYEDGTFGPGDTLLQTHLVEMLEEACGCTW